MQQTPVHIVVVGASAGGLKNLCDLAAGLKPLSNVAYFFVLHLSKEQLGSFLLERLSKCTKLPCKLAVHEADIEAGTIYIAVPDHHLLVKDNQIKLTHGAMENRWRPSIDVLFRSAAVAYKENCIGIILSGLLQDGTSGMLSIQQCGGAIIVQDPEEAEYPEMPSSVSNALPVDHTVRIDKMAKIIEDIVSKPRNKVAIPPRILQEATISEKNATQVADVASLGGQTTHTCLDCGGVLWELEENGITRFRCYTSHSYTRNDLSTRQSEELESTLWVALRMMEERKALLQKMWQQETKNNMQTLAGIHKTRLAELEIHIGKLKSILLIE